MLTPAEKAAVAELSVRFAQRLDETEDVEPLISEMYAADFTKRYLKEARKTADEDKAYARRILYVPGLEYDATLLSEATEDDWRALYVNTFNFMQYGLVVVFNAEAANLTAGKETDDDKLDDQLRNMYPPDVMTLVNKNVFLRNMVRKGNDAHPMKTVEELRGVNKVLADINQLLRKTGKGKPSGEAQKALKLVKEKLGDQLGPSVDICTTECFGFPKGTRTITLFATPMHSLLIAKVGADYKIISAQITSPD